MIGQHNTKCCSGARFNFYSGRHCILLSLLVALCPLCQQSSCFLFVQRRTRPPSQRSHAYFVAILSTLFSRLHFFLCLTSIRLSLSSPSPSPSSFFLTSCPLPSSCATFSFNRPSCNVQLPHHHQHHHLHLQHPPNPNPSMARQLRPSSLMRADGAVWAVELTTFTGPNENDPSSLAGLSPHWPNFIMANYHSRPLLLHCCCCPAPIYMDTWTH